MSDLSRGTTQCDVSRQMRRISAKLGERCGQPLLPGPTRMAGAEFRFKCSALQSCATVIADSPIKRPEWMANAFHYRLSACHFASVSQSYSTSGQTTYQGERP